MKKLFLLSIAAIVSSVLVSSAFADECQGQNQSQCNAKKSTCKWVPKASPTNGSAHCEKK